MRNDFQISIRFSPAANLSFDFDEEKAMRKKKTNSVVAFPATHIHHLLADILRRMEIRVTSISIFNEEKATEYL